MPPLIPEPDAQPRSDADLILAVRAGDSEAIEELYRRHHRAATSFAESIAGRVLAPDLVSDAFVRIIDLVKRGGGPTAVFRSYLYSTVRNLYVDHIRRFSRQTSVPDFALLEAELAIGDGLDDQFEYAVVRRAFAALPERWQIALWCTTVEGVSLQEAGRYLGVAPNAVAALTFRAREGLRQAYLAEHLQQRVDQDCAEVWEVLPRYVRGTLRDRMLREVEEHLSTCRHCTAAVSELGEVNSNLRGVLLLGLLGAGTAGYLESALSPGGAPPAAAGASARGWAVRAAAALGTAATIGAVVLAWPQGHPADVPGSLPRPSASAPSAPEHHGPSTTGVRPRPAGTGTLRVGSVATARLTRTSPSWYHLVVPISAPEAGLTLVARASGWRDFRVHREPSYGAWVCEQGEAENRTERLLTCHLPAEATGSLDLGLDLQVEGRTTVEITVRSSGAQVRTRTVVGG